MRPAAIREPAAARRPTAPPTSIELPLELPEGSYRIRGPQLPWKLDVAVRPAATLRLWEIDLASGTAPDLPPAGLRAGGQVLVLKNGHDRELVIRVERTASRTDALTAARAASLALFRELFPGEILAPGQLARGEATRALRLRAGIHRGPALAATLNDQLDYFGTTARLAAATLRYACGGQLVMTQAVAADPEVAALLNERRLATEVVPAEPGGETHVIRVRLDGDTGRSIEGGT